MDKDELRFTIQTYLHLWGIPKGSHRQEDFAMGKRNLTTLRLRLSLRDYRNAVQVIREWVGV